MGLGASCSFNMFDGIYGGGGVPFPWTEFVCQCEVTMSVTGPASRRCSTRLASVLSSTRTRSTARALNLVFTDETSFILSAAGQDEVASGTATPHGGQVLRASKHADFVAQETGWKESQSGFQWPIRVFCERSDVISVTACALHRVPGRLDCQQWRRDSLRLSRHCRKRRNRWRMWHRKASRANSTRHHHRYAEQSPHWRLLVSTRSLSGPSPLTCGHREIFERIRHHAKHVVARVWSCGDATRACRLFHEDDHGHQGLDRRNLCIGTGRRHDSPTLKEKQDLKLNKRDAL